MNTLALIPLFLGMVTIIQAGMNKKIGEVWGLSGAVLLSSIVLFICAALFVVLVGRSDFYPEAWKSKIDMKLFSPWFLISGVCGFTIVLGIPFSMGKLGASTTSVLIIAAQILTSLIWDYYVDAFPVSKEKLIGIFLVMIGSIFVGR